MVEFERVWRESSENEEWADYAERSVRAVQLAALKAIEEPSEEMIEAAASHVGQQSYADVWRDMLSTLITSLEEKK